MWASHVTHSDSLIILSNFNNVPVPLHDVEHFKNKRTLSRKHLTIIYRENMTLFLNYVTATLMALFA